ncbi:MAG: glycerol-3-phosphate 1-O-acyltransferase PlsY [Dictyoglomi bacterium]|nr:glycerol-3-phosphate 1-O-acyltransferase PlsY [Dictyoglomota bacterium]
METGWWLPVLFAYFLGAIPFGYLIGKYMYGVDVRKEGSGNTGATNVYRVLGAKAGGLTALLDISKGLIPVVVARMFFSDPKVWALTGAAAVVGHIFSVYLKFRGGKGIATSFGVGLGLCTGCALFAFLVWVAVASITNYVSLASMMAFLFGTLCAYFYAPMPVTLTFLFMFLLIVFAHRSNVVRLINGTERKTRMPWQKKRDV